MVSRMPNALDAADLAYRWAGRTDPAAPTLVLLHGLGDSGDCWPDAVRRWSPRYRVVGVDLLGHGRSPRFTAGQLASPDPMEEMYAAALATVRRVAAARPGHPGRALDGWGHRHRARRAAPRPRPRGGPGGARLARPRTAGPAPGRGGRAHRRLPTLRRGPRRSPGRRAAGTTRPGPTPSWSRGRAPRPRSTRRSSSWGWRRSPHRGRSWCERSRVPTLVLVGARSTLLGARIRARADALANPQVRIETLDAGHCVRRDVPETYHALVDPWLAEHAADVTARPEELLELGRVVPEQVVHALVVGRLVDVERHHERQRDGGLDQDRGRRVPTLLHPGRVDVGSSDDSLARARAAGARPPRLPRSARHTPTSSSSPVGSARSMRPVTANACDLRVPELALRGEATHARRR